MKDTKRRLEWFSYYDHTGLEAHLERMAERGWLLEKIGNFTWRYRRIEPKKLTFCVSYFPRASLFDPEPSQEQETFYDFCAHTGWTLAASSAQMQIFYNQRPNPVPIDTDPAMEVEAIHQSAKKSWLLSQILFLIVAALNIGQFLLRLRSDPITTLSSSLSLLACVFWPVLLLLVGADLAVYFHWRRRALKAAEQGEFLATKSHPLLQKLALAALLMGLAWGLFYLRGGMAALVVVSIACTFGIVFLVVRLRELLKQSKVSAEANRAVTLGACVILPIIMVVLGTALVLSAGGRMWEDDREPPLTMDDLLETDFDYSQSYREERSPALVHFEGREAPWRREEIADAPSLDYTAAVVKFPPIYDLCKNHLLHENDTRGTGFLPVKYYAPTDPAPWGAEEAYRFVMDGEPMNLYLLCYGDRIVRLQLDWEPTPRQMATVAKKLGGRLAP